jgi:hypothetical protein
MIQASGWEDTATEKSKVVVHIAEITGYDLRMANVKGFVFQDLRVQGTHIHLSHVSFLAV